MIEGSQGHKGRTVEVVALFNKYVGFSLDSHTSLPEGPRQDTGAPPLSAFRIIPELKRVICNKTDYLYLDNENTK